MIYFLDFLSDFPQKVNDSVLGKLLEAWAEGHPVATMIYKWVSTNIWTWFVLLWVLSMIYESVMDNIIRGHWRKLWVSMSILIICLIYFSSNNIIFETMVSAAVFRSCPSYEVEEYPED